MSQYLWDEISENPWELEVMWNESFSFAVPSRILCKLDSVFGKAEKFARPGGWVKLAYTDCGKPLARTAVVSKVQRCMCVYLCIFACVRAVWWGGRGTERERDFSLDELETRGCAGESGGVKEGPG